MEGGWVLGRAAGYGSGPVTPASEPGRERPERGCGEPVEEVERAPGESEAGRHRGQAGGSERGQAQARGQALEQRSPQQMGQQCRYDQRGNRPKCYL